MASLVPEAKLCDLLAAATRGRGAASVALIDRAGGEPVACWEPVSDREPAFLAYSITKTFTAALVLLACEEGQLTLGDALARWFPLVPHADRITLRMLLGHTSGIPDYGGTRAYHDDVARSPETPWSFERYAAETWERGLAFEPGRGWGYSNPGYLLLKRILETTLGASYHALVEERIARPLGLARTAVAETLDDLAALAPGTSRELSPDGAPRDVRAHYHPGWVAHGVVASTATDLVRFLDALFRGALVSRDSLEHMAALAPLPGEPGTATRHRAPSYGLGLMGDLESPWGPLLGHNGGGPCYGASAFHAPRLDRASACVMGAIEEGFDAEELVYDVFDTLANRRRAQ